MYLYDSSKKQKQTKNPKPIQNNNNKNFENGLQMILPKGKELNQITTKISYSL